MLASAIKRHKAQAKPKPECVIILDPVEIGEPAGEVTRLEMKSFEHVRCLSRTMGPGSFMAEKIRELLAPFDVWMAEDEALRDRCGLTAAYLKEGRLSAEACEAEDDLISTPAPVMPALLSKARTVLRPENSDAEAWQDALLADIERLTGRASLNA